MIFHRISKERLFCGFVLVVRLSLGCVFLWSSVVKIRQPYDFLSSVYDFELVGPKLAMLVAMTLPWVELLVDVCLVGGIFVGGALLIGIAMAVMFTFVLTSALYRGLEISCGCFSTSSVESITYATLIRVCVMLLLSILTYCSLVLLQPRAEQRIEQASS